MSKPDVLTVVAGQMVTYHNGPALPVAPAAGVNLRPDLIEDEREELYRLISDAFDSGIPDAVQKVVTPLLMSRLSHLDTVRLCGWLVGMIDNRR